MLLGEAVGFFLLIYMITHAGISFILVRRKRTYVSDPNVTDRYGAYFSLFTISKEKFPYKVVYWLFIRKLLFGASLVALSYLDRVQAFSFFGLIFVVHIISLSLINRNSST